jgi:hypothetical protein
MVIHTLKIEIAEQVAGEVALVVAERGRIKLQIDLFYYLQELQHQNLCRVWRKLMVQ